MKTVETGYLLKIDGKLWRSRVPKNEVSEAMDLFPSQIVLDLGDKLIKPTGYYDSYPRIVSGYNKVDRAKFQGIAFVFELVEEEE